MSEGSKPLERLPTGIPGLDSLLEGGLLQGGVYILLGPPGAGKTILANQVCFHHAGAGKQVMYVTLLAESHTRMLAHMQRMHFFNPDAIPDSIYYLSAFKVLEAEGLVGLLRTLRATMTERRPSLLVLDGLASAREASDSKQAFKKFIHELQALCGLAASTALLLTSTENERGSQPEHTMVDGLIELSEAATRLRPVRHLEIRKLRGTDQVRGPHTMEISDAGIVVHQRVETRFRPSAGLSSRVPGSARKAFGVLRLDEMLHGGLLENSVTLLLGPSGVGKTTLGLQFLAEGARRGEPGVYFGLYERPEALLAKADRISLGLRQGLERGLLDLVWTPPIEVIVDELGERLLEVVQRRRARLLFIDGLQEFAQVAEFPTRIREVLSALVERLEGVTVVYTLESPDLLGQRVELPIQGVSVLTHNMILLRHVELRSHLYRLISILKVRDSSYDASIREFCITDQGIQVADTFQSAEGILSGLVTPGLASGPGEKAESPTVERHPEDRGSGNRGT